jgi:drug/metabolite transporter (DMT)-like permease
MSTAAAQRRGLLLGLVAVLIFSVTLPVTRLAVGTPQEPQLSGVFVALARAVIAALLSALYLLAVRAPWPERRHWPALIIISLGVVLGFPLCTSVALRHVEAVHASAIQGVLPLSTAVLGALLNRQRPSVGFWVCAGLGSALVMAYALLRSGPSAWVLHPADALLLLGMVAASMGYVWGARLSGQMPPEQVICWSLLVALPLTVPGTWLSMPTEVMQTRTWVSLVYLAVFPMWVGFFFWYRGLSLGGTVRVSQVQLLQPFLSMLFAVALVGESLDAMTLGFALAVMATVLLGRKMAVHPLARPADDTAKPP